MESIGVDSPMFDFVEQTSGKPTPQPLSQKQKTQKERQALDKQAKQLNEQDAIEQVEQM